MDVPIAATGVVVGSGWPILTIDIVPGIVRPPSPTSRLHTTTPLPLGIPLPVISLTRQFTSVLIKLVFPAPRSPTTMRRGDGISSSGRERSVEVREEGRARRRRRERERWRER